MMKIRKINLLRDTELLIKIIPHSIKSQQTTVKFFEQIVKCGGTILICEEHHQIIAFIVIEIINSPLNTKMIPMITFYYVIPSRRNQGIEEQLLLEAEKWCSYRKFTELFIKVSIEDPIMIKLTEKPNYETLQWIKRKSISSFKDS